MSITNLKFQGIDAMADVARMEKELELARQRLAKLNRGRYQTDSETEQSG